MFLFGDAGDAARTYLEYVMVDDQRRFSDAPADELSLEELQNALVWLNIAIAQSRREEVDKSIYDTLLDWYDEVFKADAAVSDRLLKAIKKGYHVPPTGRRDLPKYVAIAEGASES